MISARTALALALAGIALAVLLVLGAYGAQSSRQAAEQAGGLALQVLARESAERLASQLRERELQVRLLSETSPLRDMPLDSAAVAELLERHRQLYPAFAWLGVADAQGQVRSASGGLLLGLSVQQRDWFRSAQSQAFVGDRHEAKLLAKLLPPPADGEPLRFIDFAAPVLDRDGRLRAVLGTHVHWSWVQALVGEVLQAHGGQGVELLLLDRQRRVLYPQSLAGQRLSPLVETPGMLQREVAVEPQAALGWRIQVRQPLQQALGPLQAQLREMLLVGLAVALVGSGLVWLLAAALSRPVQRLADTAQRIEAGAHDTPFPPPEGPAELRTLAAAVRGMTEALLRKERELEAANAGLEQQVLQRTQALEQANAELGRLATRDALTGAYNRRWFDARLAECGAQLRRCAQPHALLLVDADHFKQVNDRHGHDVGDAVLRALVALLQAHTRSTDGVVRLGGEEFAVLVPAPARPEEAGQLAEKLRAAAEQAVFPGVGRLTLSLGYSLGSAQDRDGAALLKRADQALYRAKATGRNRVEFEPPPAA